MAFRSKTGPNSIIGGNLPIFGKAPIVASDGLALTGHHLHGVEAAMAMTAPPKRAPCNKQNDGTPDQGADGFSPEEREDEPIPAGGRHSFQLCRHFPRNHRVHWRLALDFSLRGIVLSRMASAADYRIYELTIGNQVAGSHTIVCDSDQNAIEKAKKMLVDRDLEIRHGARFVARLRVADNK